MGTNERLRALETFLAEYEDETGPLTQERIDAARQWLSERTVRTVVSSARPADAAA